MSLYKTSYRTIFGSLVALAQRFNESVRILPNSTLNQKWNVQNGQLPNAGEVPFTNYYCFGLNGVEITLEQGLYRAKFRNYQPGQASPFLPFPQVMRPISEGLDPAQRKDLRGRVLMEINGVVYEAWMLAVLPKTGQPADAEKRITINGIIQPDKWEPDLSALNPDPTQLNPNQQVTGSREFLAASKKIPVVIGAERMQELLNAANILYGDIGFAEISEFALVSGVDRQVVGDFNGVQQNYTEAIYAQCSDFLRVRFNAADNLMGKTLFLEVGSSDPVGIQTV